MRETLTVDSNAIKMHDVTLIITWRNYFLYAQTMTTQFEPVQLGSIALFCKAAELGSFAKAAEAIGVTPAAVSRSIARLEMRLGSKLFARTTRQIRLTDDGELYYRQCSQAVTQIEEVERLITGKVGSPKGRLRISAPTTYGHFRLLPKIAQFLALYPAIQLDINLSNRNIDFVEEGYDVAIRLGTPQDSRIVARLLEDAPLGLYASPEYLQSNPPIKKMDDLTKHRIIQFVRPSTGKGMPMIFRQDNKDLDYPFKSSLSIEEDVLGGVSLAKSGAGLFQIYRFVVEREVASGELVEVLKKNAGRSRPFHLLYPKHRQPSATLRAFIAFMTANDNATVA
jgi:DNA-binding transcriptional LysR family regulator